MISWPQWLFRDTRHEIVVLPLVAITLIMLVYGVIMVRDGFIRDDGPHHWLNPRRWLWLALNSYEFCLGWFFIGDAALYALLTISTQRSADIDLWVALFFGVIGIWAVLAFRLWMKGR